MSVVHWIAPNPVSGTSERCWASLHMGSRSVHCPTPARRVRRNGNRSSDRRCPDRKMLSIADHTWTGAMRRTAAGEEPRSRNAKLTRASADGTLAVRRDSWQPSIGAPCAAMNRVTSGAVSSVSAGVSSASPTNNAAIASIPRWFQWNCGTCLPCDAVADKTIKLKEQPKLKPESGDKEIAGQCRFLGGRTVPTNCARSNVLAFFDPVLDAGWPRVLVNIDRRQRRFFPPQIPSRDAVTLGIDRIYRVPD
jgi:hypothetical protein